MRTQICYLILVCLLLFAPSPLIQAQKIIKKRSTLGVSGSTGSFSSQNKRYYITQSIGQPGITGTSSTQNNSLIQGFIQPIVFRKEKTSSTISELGVLMKTDPFSNSYKIIILDNEIMDINVSVYNTMGQKVLNQEVNQNYEFEINLNSQPIGCYILHLQANQQHFTTKILKK